MQKWGTCGEGLCLDVGGHSLYSLIRYYGLVRTNVLLQGAAIDHDNNYRHHDNSHGDLNDHQLCYSYFTCNYNRSYNGYLAYHYNRNFY